MKGGAKFDELAKTQSTDGSKTNGGDLGWFSLARMVKPFGDAVKTLKKGEYTQEPVQTQFGWHIIKLEDTREVTAPPFDQVKPQITNAVIRKKLQAVEVAAAKGQYGPGHITYAGWEPLPVPAMAPPGWYPDNSGQAPLRWWDGRQWTPHTSTGGPPSP